MKKKRVFYVLEKLLKSDADNYNQHTESYISSDSVPKQNNNVEENISNNRETQITEAQKTRRQKWIEELQGKPKEEASSSRGVEATPISQDGNEQEETSNLNPFNIEQGDSKGKFDFSFSVRGKRISVQKSDDLSSNGSNMQLSSQGQNGGQQGQANASDMQGQQGNPQDSSTQGNGEPQNNRVKQLFSELDKVSESIDKGHGFALSPLKIEDGQVPDSLINMLIDKFLNQRFLPMDTDLNTRRNSFDPEYGALKWNIPDLIRHKVTKDLNKMLYDKYGFNDEDGKGEDVPLSFYFDLSGSMEAYSRFLSLVAIKLIRKDVKVLFGFNERIYYQIDSVPKTFTAEDFRRIISENLSYEQLTSDPRYRNIKIKQVNEDINKYLREKKAKKLTVFSDFDPKRQIEDLSKDCEIWWFCFEQRSNYRNTSMKDFKGHFYNTEKLEDFIKHLKNISSRVYEKRQRTIRNGGIERE